MTSTFIPTRPPGLPKADALHGAQRVLEELAAFVEANATYQKEGSEHLRNVIRFVEWAGHNQHIARRVD